MQLDALLRSFYLNKSGNFNLFIQLKASTKKYMDAYSKLIADYENRDSINFIVEKGKFKSTLIKTLTSLNTNKVFFLVDDQIFIRKFDLIDFKKIKPSFTIFSLRMGIHLEYSYVVNKKQKLPSFLKLQNNFLRWLWIFGELDWKYPVSVDGHLFSTSEILVLSKLIEFSAPNSFEAQLQQAKILFMYRFGKSYKNSRIINLPINKVQNEINNHHGTIHQDYLLDQWNQGKRININPLQNRLNKSVHEDIEIDFESYE